MSTTASQVLRDDLRAFAGYQSARKSQQQGHIFLNANESPFASDDWTREQWRHYPSQQPLALIERLAALYGCAKEQLLATRGSDEAIDVLVRAFCEPGGSAIVTAPPVFGMYAVCAKLHGTRVVEIPAQDKANGWHSDLPKMVAATREAGASLMFVCSPGNPTGEGVHAEALRGAARALQGHALLVVDAAYAEFQDEVSAQCLLAEFDNVVILRTLSKAHALAAARIGVAIASPEIIQILSRVQAPYPLAAPAVEAALTALSEAQVTANAGQVAMVRESREQLQDELRQLACVRKVYPSQGNFSLVRFADAQAAFDALLTAGIVVRDFRATPGLENALRITVGTPEQNALVILSLAALGDS